MHFFNNQLLKIIFEEPFCHNFLHIKMGRFLVTIIIEFSLVKIFLKNYYKQENSHKHAKGKQNKKYNQQALK